MLDLAGGFAQQQAGFRLGQVDPAAVQILCERGVVGGGIHRKERQFEACLAGRRAVALSRGAGLLHQQRRDVVREVKWLRLVRLGKKRQSDGSGDDSKLRHVIGFAWPDACPGIPWLTRGRAGCRSDP